MALRWEVEPTLDELYRDHSAAAWRVALAVTDKRDDALDAMAEGFTRVFKALAAGRLADVPFRPYLLTTVRNVAIDQHRRARYVQLDDLPERPTTDRGPSEKTTAITSAHLMREAFRSLPERWRLVLWLTEVEGMPTREVGDRLGISANGVSQLSRRARSGLRGRYLQAHLRHRPRPACEQTVSQLGAYAAGTLRARAASRVDEHLAGCEACQKRTTELEEEM